MRFLSADHRRICEAPIASEEEERMKTLREPTRRPSNPPGWVDALVGNPKSEAAGLYKVWNDPLQPSNVVYGTKQSSGKLESNKPHIGTFSTLLWLP